MRKKALLAVLHEQKRLSKARQVSRAQKQQSNKLKQPKHAESKQPGTKGSSSRRAGRSRYIVYEEDEEGKGRLTDEEDETDDEGEMEDDAEEEGTTGGISFYQRTMR
ncbi:hypothetical protein V8E36_002780 [Tilletia maclaganii]